MRMKFFHPRSFHVKVLAALVFSMLFVGTLSGLTVYNFAVNSLFDQLRDKLIIIAQTAALMVDPDSLVKVPLNKNGINTPEYQDVAENLLKIQKVNPSLVYIYTMTIPDERGMCRFIVDPSIPTEEERQKGITSYPGDKYDATRFPEMLNVRNGPTADKNFGKDEWGTFLSGYAPILTKKGEPVAILGVDLRADDVQTLQKEFRLRAILVIVFGIIFSITSGVYISKIISRPIRNLSEGTRHAAKGDFSYKVEVIGDDEIGELTSSFNSMTDMIAEAKDKLNKSFIHVLQSVALIIESKDPYLKSHSERVADYAIKISTVMGFPPNKIELLKEAALLHNIGNLIISEDILSKKGKLSTEEWEIIKKHPVVGEEILKPILAGEILEIIRSHHERYDGTGYPDRLSGENISTFAQIISVADAFSAMTSPRPYRTALGKDQAINEIIQSRGTQFDVRVVTAFLKVMEANHEKK